MTVLPYEHLAVMTAPEALSVRAVDSQSLDADIVADFVAQATKSMQVSIEGMKPATLRAGLRRALKGNEDLKMVQRGEGTHLVRKVYG